MDSLCECFNLTQHQLGLIMKMCPFQLKQWQTGGKRPNIIKIFRLMFFLLRHYHRYCRRELIATEYRWGKSQSQSTSLSAFETSSQTSKKNITTGPRMASSDSIGSASDNIDPELEAFEKQIFQTHSHLTTDKAISKVDKTH